MSKMSWLIPRRNPYWNKDIGKEVELERRQKVIELALPTKKDWEQLAITKKLLAQPQKREEA